MKPKFCVELMTVCKTVTGSQILVVVHRINEKLKFIVDCGYDFERSQEGQELITKYPDAVILTHAHNDHVALIPELCKTYNGNIYTSKDTKTLLGDALDDTLHIQKMDAKKKKTKVLYREDDVEKSTFQVRSLPNYKPIEIFDNIFCTLIPNAHIPGSCCVYLEIYLNDWNVSEEYNIPPIKLFFTGDFKSSGNAFLEDLKMPKRVFEDPVYIISESTYGADKKEREEVFADNIITATKTEKRIICPVLALGRGQQILYELRKLQEVGDLSTDVPVFVDGVLFQRYIKKYKRKLDVKIKDFEPYNLRYISRKTRKWLNNKHFPCIILATSGNASFGAANEYVLKNIENKDAVIHFTSFQHEDTLGRRLVESNGDDEVLLNGKICNKKAKVFMTSEFSSHEEKHDLIDFICKFKNPKGVFFTHGEKEARENMVRLLTQKEGFSTENVFDFSMDKFFRIDRQNGGGIKIINSKF